jgi:hypothetical protein
LRCVGREREREQESTRGCKSGNGESEKISLSTNYP